MKTWGVNIVDAKKTFNEIDSAGSAPRLRLNGSALPARLSGKENAPAAPEYRL